MLKRVITHFFSGDIDKERTGKGNAEVTSKVEPMSKPSS